MKKIILSLLIIILYSTLLLANVEQIYNDLDNLNSNKTKVAEVTDFQLQQDSAIFNFKSGKIYLLSEVDGKNLGAVF